MAVAYTGSKTQFGDYPEIIMKIYSDSPTFRGETIEVVEGHKSGIDVYESSAAVTFSAVNYGSVTADNVSLKANKTTVNLKPFNVEGIIDESSLLGTRFEKSMAAGAYNLISDEFDRRVLVQVQPAISEKLEDNVWNGATAATKAAIAALTPGAGQGSVSAGAQTLVAAMPVTFFDSVTATMIYNDSQAKATPGAGIGDYIKVAGTTVNSGNIVAEYVKIYNGILNKVLVATGEMVPVIYAPKAHYKLIKNVNRVQGADLQENFLGSSYTDMSFNDIKIVFVDLVGFVMVGAKSNFKLISDLLSDSSQLIIEKEANASTRRVLKMINTMNTHVVLQDMNVLYNG